MHKGLYALLRAPVRSIPDGERGGSGADDTSDGKDQADDQADDQQDDGADDQGDDQQDDADDQSDQADHGDEDQSQAQQSRGSRRIQEQARINREAREAADAANRRADAAEAREAATAAATREQREAREAAEEREALATMSDEQRAVYQLAKGHKSLDQKLSMLGVQSRDGNDRAAFSDYINSDEGKRFAKYRSEVENIARQATANGQPVARELILNQLIARDVRGGKTVEVQRAAAKKRVDNARGRGAAQPSDTGGRSGKKLNHVQRMEKGDFAI